MHILESHRESRKMKILNPILSFSIVVLVLVSCYTAKKHALNATPNTPCLILYPPTYHNVRFNPEWIVQNQIESIIEREYLDGRNGKIHLVTILEYDSNGYLKTKHSGLSYPKDDSPNKKDIFSRWEYETEIIDSFVIHSSKIIRFHNEEGRMEKPDTLQMGGSIYNTNKATEFLNQNGELVRFYEYDKSDRLIAEKNNMGELNYSIIYHDDGKIEISEFSRWQNRQFSSWITLDNLGRIVINFDESNNLTHEFKYDDNGKMVEEKLWFKGKEPNFHTFEFITKDSR